jgi:hypothetical protein
MSAKIPAKVNKWLDVFVSLAAAVVIYGALQKLLATLTPQLRASKLAAKVRWNIDVDPMEF